MKNMILNIKKHLLKDVEYYLDMIDSYYKTNEECDILKESHFANLVDLYKWINVLNKLEKELLENENK